MVQGSAVDAVGCPLAEAHRKTFLVLDGDRSAPDLDAWSFEVPPARTRQPLALELDGPYDHLSLAYRLRVVDAAGETVAGSVDLADEETRWLFTPAAAWQAAAYVLAVETTLEDLAGNRPGRLFDLAQSQATSPGSAGDSRVRIPFSPATD